MFQAENGRYTIIPFEMLAIVIEHAGEGKLIHHGAHPDMSVEESLNNSRWAINESLTHARKSMEKTLKLWNRFQVSKPFMEKHEVELNEAMWVGFDFDKYTATKNTIISGLEKSLFELTDVMLENNVAIKSLDEDVEQPIQISPEDLMKKLFDGLGKKE